MKKYVLSLVIAIVIVVLLKNTRTGAAVANQVKGVVVNAVVKPDYINTKGDSIATRVMVPDGYN